jgi:flagellar biosynthetic protein FliR
MDLALRNLVPLILVLGRVSGFMATLPVFGSKSAPLRVRAGLTLILAVVFTMLLPPVRVTDQWLPVALVLVREMLTGLALGVAVAVAFAAVRQAGEIIRMQMGLAEAEIIDPTTGDETQPLGMLLETGFLLLFVTAGGHRLLLDLMARSYAAFPLGAPASVETMARVVLEAGTTMLVFGLKLAAPMLVGFLLLAVALAVLARALPEMNVLMASLPLRVGLGFFLAAALVPALEAFTRDLGLWLSRLAA